LWFGGWHGQCCGHSFDCPLASATSRTLSGVAVRSAGDLGVNGLLESATLSVRFAK